MSRTTEETAETQAKELSDWINNMGIGADEYQAFAEQIVREHRTLQQKIFALMFVTIREWSHAETYDEKNKATVELSKAIISCVGANPSIPYI